MDGLKDVFTPFYERLRRPFLGAYWIAVFSFNWRVWTALFFYEEQVNGVDKIDFIAKQLTVWNLFVYPVACALGFILIGALLDVGVFWYQQWIRAWKREIQEKRERDRMVPAETFNRVKEERDQKASKLTVAENDITILQKELSDRAAQTIMVKQLQLIPDLNYFRGKWDISQPGMPALELEFGSDWVELRFKEGVNSKSSKNDKSLRRKMYTHKRIEYSILIIYQVQTDDWSEALKILTTSLSGSDNLVKLFQQSLPYWEIPISSIYKEEFAVSIDRNGTQVVFRRQVPWDRTMKLWSNDTDGQFPLPQR